MFEVYNPTIEPFLGTKPCDVKSEADLLARQLEAKTGLSWFVRPKAVPAEGAPTLLALVNQNDMFAVVTNRGTDGKPVCFSRMARSAEEAVLINSDVFTDKYPPLGVVRLQAVQFYHMEQFRGGSPLLI